MFTSHYAFSTRLRRVALVSLGVTVLVAVSAPAASAHVTARADSTAAGSFSQITFRVPNESTTAGTVAVQVQLPQDKPFRLLSVKPVPGWTATVEQATLPEPVEEGGATITKAPRTVTWKAAEGTRIQPGEYQEFSVSAGPLPAAGDLVMPATQTYSDGEVVAWDEPPTGSGEPEHPAPTVTVVAAADGDNGHGSEASADPSTETAAVDSGPDAVARWLAGGALVVALAAAGLAARPRTRTPRG